MKKYAKKQLRKALNNSYLLPISNLFTPIFSGIGTIVTLHRLVTNDKDIICEDLEYTTEYLEGLISYFTKKNYEIVSLDTAYEIINEKIKTKKKFVVFTFDDGYVDNYTLAYPIFKKYNMPFTIYITTSFPDRTAVLWWYALKDLTNKNKVIKFNFNGKEYMYHNEKVNNNAYYELRDLILSLNIEQQRNLFRILFDENGIDTNHYVEELAMSWDQIKELASDRLVTIGAHTTNHFKLKALDSGSVKKEILDAKEKIESITGVNVDHFAFPFGSENEVSHREFEIAGKLNFKTCTTTRCGNIFLEHAQHMSSLPRIAPSPDLLISFPHYYTTGFFPALRHKFKRVITD